MHSVAFVQHILKPLSDLSNTNIWILCFYVVLHKRLKSTSACTASSSHATPTNARGQPFLTSMTPWWMEVYCFFLSITRVMTITVAMTTPPTIRPMMAPLLEPTSSAKKTCGCRAVRWSVSGATHNRLCEFKRYSRGQHSLRFLTSFAVLAVLNYISYLFLSFLSLRSQI